MKKLLALLTAASLVMGMATTAFAADDEGVSDGTTGQGGVEFVYNENVFLVDLPTVPDGDTTFDFFLDPMQVIAATQEEEGQDKVLGDGMEDATLFFANVDDNDTPGDLEDDEVTYSNVSDGYSITNMSSFGVTITVEAKIVDPAVLTVGELSAKFVEELTEDTITDAEVVLTLQDSEKTDTANITTAGDYTATISLEVEALEDAYELKVDPETGEYSYDLTDEILDDPDTAFEDHTVEIQLTGECNQHDNWNKLGDIAPKVELTWTITAGTTDEEVTDFENRNVPGAPSIPNYDVAIDATAAVNVDIVLPTDDAEIDAISFTSSNGDTGTLKLGTTSTSTGKYADGVLTLTTKHITAISDEAQVITYTVTFEDSEETFTFTVTVK